MDMATAMATGTATVIENPRWQLGIVGGAS